MRCARQQAGARRQCAGGLDRPADVLPFRRQAAFGQRRKTLNNTLTTRAAAAHAEIHRLFLADASSDAEASIAATAALPRERSQSLDAAAYRDPALADLEKEILFRKNWI